MAIAALRGQLGRGLVFTCLFAEAYLLAWFAPSYDVSYMLICQCHNGQVSIRALAGDGVSRAHNDRGGRRYARHS